MNQQSTNPQNPNTVQPPIYGNLVYGVYPPSYPQVYPGYPYLNNRSYPGFYPQMPHPFIPVVNGAFPPYLMPQVIPVTQSQQLPSQDPNTVSEFNTTPESKVSQEIQRRLGEKSLLKKATEVDNKENVEISTPVPQNKTEPEPELLQINTTIEETEENKSETEANTPTKDKKQKKYYPSQSRSAKIPVLTFHQRTLLNRLRDGISIKNVVAPDSLPVKVRIIQPSIVNSSSQQSLQQDILKQYPEYKDYINKAVEPNPIKEQLTNYPLYNENPQNFNNLSQSFSQPKRIFSTPSKNIYANYNPNEPKFNPNKPKKSKRKISKILRNIAVGVMAIALGIGLGGYQTGLLFKTPEKVAGAIDYSSLNSSSPEYIKWITDKLGQFVPQTEDTDADGLTNKEEFILGSNPKNPNTCDPKQSDSQLVYNLIDPSTCKPMNLSDTNEFAKYSAVIDIGSIKQEIINSVNKQDTGVVAQNTDESFLSMFGVSSYESLDKLTAESLQKEAASKQTSIQYLKTIDKIKKYIDKYRSYDTQDRNYPTPVSSSKYLEVSLKYNVPLKYMLALARTESRFGTDKFSNDGNETRISKYKNIYSLGLTDSGNNLGFTTWDDGVEAFGKWYKRFNDRGVSDCKKWSIYNPNGDYCTKIENLATSIDTFLSQA